jgi:hypothetical protein
VREFGQTIVMVTHDPVAASYADRWSSSPTGASSTSSVSGFAALAGPDGQLVGEGWSTTGANYDGADGDDARYPMIQGRAPGTEGEIAIDARTAGRTGYAVGDIVRLSVSGPVRRSGSPASSPPTTATSPRAAPSPSSTPPPPSGSSPSPAGTTRST